MKFLFCLTLLAAIAALSLAANPPCNNTQIHISLSDYFNTLNKSDPMLKIAFHTAQACEKNHVLLKLDNGSSIIIPASSAYFTDVYRSGTYKTFVHYSSVFNIKFDTIYQYSVYDSSQGLYQGPYKFKIPNPKPVTSRQRNYIVFGDFDHSDTALPSMKFITKYANNESNSVDAIIHYGDLAYNLDKKAGARGDEYMQVVSDNFARSYPYMIAPGNHEIPNNFSILNVRFQMPQFNKTQNHLYSFNVENVHFISFSLELPALQGDSMAYAVEWLKKDLKAANENRAERPWIIVYTHRPIYCTACPYGQDHETLKAAYLLEAENLFAKYGVDLHFSGHVHTYERLLPVLHNKVAKYTSRKGDANYNYIQDAQAPVYIVEGSPGFDWFTKGRVPKKPKLPYVHADGNLSVGVLSVMNKTHLLWKMVHTETGEVKDFMYLSKTKLSYNTVTSTQSLRASFASEEIETGNASKIVSHILGSVCILGLVVFAGFNIISKMKVRLEATNHQIA